MGKNNCRKLIAPKPVSLLVIVLFAAMTGFSAEPAGRNAEFEEILCSFDGDRGDRPLPPPWQQNRTGYFQPFGKAEIIKAPFGSFQNALRMTSGEVHTHVYITNNIPVRLGDVLKVDAGFRSPDGKTPAFCGIYGEYQTASFKPVGKGWDFRYVYFDIKNPKTRSVRFFVQCPKNASVDFSYLKYRKLRPEEIKVYSPAKNLRLWEERTQGTNLAKGKKVIFDPVPNHWVTVKGGTDDKDLTDGQVYRGSGMLHFRSEAVGWDKLHGGIVTIVIDLGETKPVRKGVIRITGGRNEHAFPKKLSIWGSRDGENFFRGQSLTKLNKLEEYLSNFKDVYYLPETVDNSGPTYEYPFELELNADARYVAFQMQAPRNRLFSDEAAVIRAEPKETESPEFNRIYRQAPKIILHESIILRTRMDTMYIAEGKWFPNFLILDCRRKGVPGERFTFSIDMPYPVEYHHSLTWPDFIRKFEKSEKQGKRVVFHFKSEAPIDKNARDSLPVTAERWGFGPFFFRVRDAGLVPEEERYVVFRTYCSGKLEKSVKLPLKILKMPEVNLKRLANSMSLGAHQTAFWPDFIPTIKSVGFNVLPVKPDYEVQLPLLEKYLEEAGKSANRYCLYSYIVEQRKPAEFYCPVPGTAGTACLAYRGPFYRQMLAKLEEQVRKYPCDYISFDVEAWEPQSMNNAMKCPRCDELRKKMKMNWVEYFSWAQAEYLKPFKAAAVKGAKAAGRTPPKIGFYALSPGSTSFRYSCKEGPVDFLGGFSRMFPAYTDLAMFCHYGRDTAPVHRYARAVYDVLKDPSISIPWISGGTGAYFSESLSHRNGQHFLEAVLNGSGGVQVFAYRSFESPLDYYCFAKAAQQIAPFEDLLMEGSLDPGFTGSNRKLLYTKRDWKGKSLILIGNYGTASGAETTLPLKGKVTALISGETRKADGSYLVKIPADDYVLLLAE